MAELTRRQRYLKQWTALEAERSTWIPHWRDIADYMAPRSFRYLVTDRNRGTKRNSRIINSVAGMSVRTEAAGMMSYITNPAQQWFRLGLHDEGLSEYGPNREWLDTCEDVLRRALVGSNFYRGLHKTYQGIIRFGIACLHIDEDDQDTIRTYDLPIGQFCLANSDRLSIDTVCRKYSMTVSQLVKRFKLKNCSQMVQNNYERGNLQQWVEVLHVVEPNEDYSPGVMGTKGKQFVSIWMETGSNPGDEDRFLSERGYTEFPVMAPRWDTTGEDVYGESPGMDALGDVRGLQELERDKGKLVKKIVDPPMQGPSSLMNQRVSILTGAMNFVDSVNPSQVLRPAQDVNANAVTVVEASIREHEQRIRAVFLNDLWLSLEQGEQRGNMTAREIAERHEEKMQQLGPVLDGLERELYSPCIDRVFGVCLRAGLIPPPPREIQGAKLNIEYTSIVAQALKMQNNSGLDRLSGFVGTWVATKQDILDNVDTDAMVREYAANLGVKSTMLRPMDSVQQLRQQKQQAAEANAAAARAQALAQGAKTLSQADMSGNNGLTSLLGGLPGAATGQA